MKAISILLVIGLVIGSIYIPNGVFGSDSNDNKINVTYHITNVWELQNMSNDLTGDYILDNDIDASITSTWNGGQGFVPIGNNANYFSGSFNGNNHTISNLFINMPTTSEYVGLFGNCLNAGYIRNVGLIDADITGNYRTGGLIGSQMSTSYGIINCYVKNSTIISNNYNAGGLVGVTFNAPITNCFTINCTVYAVDSVGGLLGRLSVGLYSIITNCFSVSYSISGVLNIGGLVGYKALGSPIGIVTSSYYDTSTSGISDTGKGEPKTTEEMKNINTYSGWDIEYAYVETQINDGYPVLHWQISDNSPVWYLPILTTAHLPIRINSDSGFNATNGVSSGAGTELDPYIIEGWNINATGYGCGIYVGNTTKYFVIRNCTIYKASGNSGNYYYNTGIYLLGLSNGKIINCIVWGNEQNIMLEFTNYSSVYDCNIYDGRYGINVYDGRYGTSYCVGNTISNCSIANQESVGIDLYFANDTNIEDCIVINCLGGSLWQGGIVLRNSFGNVTRCNIEENAYGIQVGTSNFTIHKNNFINNTIYAVDVGGRVSFWNLSHQFGGNYWYNSSKVDNYHGINQDKVGGDNIVDTPYIFTGGCDYYPLIYPFETNNTPVADAGGIYEVNLGFSVMLNGSESSDAGGLTLNYTWNVGGGSQGSGYGEFLNITPTLVGVYVVELIVRDSNGNIAYNNGTLYVNTTSYHSPIRINSDSEFNATNGVTGGTGTIGDPYIIDKWKIDATGYGCGIYVGNTTAYFEIKNCEIFNSSGIDSMYYYKSGIFMYNIINENNISNNIIYNCEGQGVYLYECDNILVYDNYFNSCWEAIRCLYSTYNKLYNNTCINLQECGFILTYSSYNEMYNNKIENTSLYMIGFVGIYIASFSTGNIIINNNIKNGYYGVYIYLVAGNTVYNNNFYNHTYNALGGMSTNYFDNGHQFGGNYYDDYAGADLYHGINQDKIGSDNMGDTNYNGYNYPLMYPFETNNTPIADAGIDQYYTGVKHINGTNSSDAGGTSLNYTWDFIYDGTHYFYYNESFDFNFSINGVYQVNLTVMDDSYNTDSDIMIIYATIYTVDAGVNQTVYTNTTVFFDGSLSFNDTINWTWTFIHLGIPITLYGVNPSFYFEADYVYEVILTGTNGMQVDTDTVYITALNRNPTANAGLDQAGLKGNYTLDGSSSYDIDGSIVNYTWSFTFNGTPYVFYGSGFIFNFSINGSYLITLNVTDDDLGYDEDTCWINISYLSPIADAGVPQSGIKGYYYLIGNGSYDPDGIIVNWTWTFTYNGTIITLYGEYIDYYFYSSGNYSILLDVTDNDGVHDTDTTWINITFVYPIADAGLDQSGVKGIYIMSGNGSYDPDGLIIWYNWTFNYNGTQYWYNSTNWFSFYFYQQGNYEITLTVTDDDGLMDTDIVWVNITWLYPVANAGTDYAGKRLITLHGDLSYDPDGWIVNYTWNFTYNGVSTYLYGVSPTFDFNISGIYIITLTVTDNDSLTDTDTVIIIVTILPPVANAGIDQSGLRGTYQFNGLSSYDPDGTIINYTWTFVYNSTTITLYGATISYYFYTIGTYVLTLNVTDNDWRYDEDTVQLIILPSYPVPIILITPDDDWKGIKEVNGAGSYDIDGYITNYTWIIEHNSYQYKFYVEVFDYNFSMNGMYNITLNLTDSDGYQSEITRSLEIVFRYPVAIIDETLFTATDVLTQFLANSSYDPDGYIVNYTWVIFYNNQTIILYGVSPNYTFVGDTEYCNMTLYITDDDGLITELNVTLFIANPIQVTGMFIFYLIILFIIGFVIIFILRKVKDSANLDGIQINNKNKRRKE